MREQVNPRSVYDFVCIDASGNIKWTDRINNLVPTEGKNWLLTTGFSATVYMSLISSVGYTALTAGDTAAQINGTNGWKEAGGANAPTYSGNRPAISLSAASGGTRTSSGVVFTFTGAGTVKGGFVDTTNTKDGTTGSLFSEGLLSGGDKPVGVGDTLTVIWSVSL